MSDPIRILHVVSKLDRGGTETWLVNVLRRIDRSRFQLDVAVEQQDAGAYADEVRSLGSKVIPLGPAIWLPSYAAALRRTFVNGSYYIVHSHTFTFSGLVMRVARSAHVPVRITHSRVDRSTGASPGLPRRVYEAVMKRWLRLHATHGLAVSENAAKGLFGSDWRCDRRIRLHHSAIELDAFTGNLDTAGVRRALGLPPQAPIIGHIGRHHEQKNQLFLIRAFAEVRRLLPEAYLVLVGSGDRLPTAERLVRELGLNDHVRLLPERPDVPTLLRGAFDILILPSLFEGLPRVAVEAQAAGLPVLLSDTITREVAVVPELVTWASLSEPPQAWAKRIRQLLATPRPVSMIEALERLRQSPFDIQQNVRQLEAFYEEALEAVVGSPHMTGRERP